MAQLIDAWIDVLGQCVGKVEVSYVKNVAMRVIQEMPGPKNPLARRMLGNRLVTTVAMNLSEESHEEERRQMGGRVALATVLRTHHRTCKSQCKCIFPGQ